MKKYIILSLVFCVASSFLIATPSLPTPQSLNYEFGRKVTLSAGTLILLELTEKIESSNMTVGQLIKFKVRSNVSVDGKVSVRTGALAIGRVKAISLSTYNNPEELHIEVTSVKAVDGQQISLDGDEQIIKGDFPGQASTAKTGTIITATVRNDVEIKIN